MQHAILCPPILTIAGSDSGGGAGIQADLKTIQALGGYGMSAITAITAQNTQGVFGVQEILPDLVEKQITLVLSDIGARAIKTGMLASRSIIDIVSKTLKVHAAGIPLVIDPVMVAKGGASLLAEDAVASLMTKLLPLATIVTPNIPEASRLSGMPIHSKADMEKAAQAILKHGVQAVVIKGGHLDTGDGLVHNLLLHNAASQWQSSPRIQTRNTHGTGCTFSAALATLLGKGLSLGESFIQAEVYVAGAIANAPNLGKGHGPLNHGFIRDP